MKILAMGPQVGTESGPGEPRCGESEGSGLPSSRDKGLPVPKWNPSAWLTFVNSPTPTLTGKKYCGPCWVLSDLWFIDGEYEIFIKTDCCFSFICHIFNLYFKTLIKPTHFFFLFEMSSIFQRWDQSRTGSLVAEGRIVSRNHLLVTLSFPSMNPTLSLIRSRVS